MGPEGLEGGRRRRRIWYERFDLGAERYLRDGAIFQKRKRSASRPTRSCWVPSASASRHSGARPASKPVSILINVNRPQAGTGVTSPRRSGRHRLRGGARAPKACIAVPVRSAVAPERSGHRSVHQHRLRRGTCGALRLQLAMKRRKHVTLVHKKNVLVNAGDMAAHRQYGGGGIRKSPRLSAHRRDHHLHGIRPVPFRRDSDRQPVR